MSNLIEHAKKEFLLAGYKPVDEEEDGPDKWIQENVFELLDIFSRQGHSGMLASYCINILTKLARFEILTPLTGADDEWNEVGEGTFQNNRCSHVFKGKDSRPYDIYGVVFRSPDGSCYTNRDSIVYIDFPYTPKTKYVDVAE